MKGAPLLSDLREPPVVGRFYMVPVVRFPWFNMEADWPVLGPMHTDAEFFGFNRRHYHVDIRFLSQYRLRWASVFLRDDLATGDLVLDAARVATGHPVNHLHRELPDGRPPLKRLKCTLAHAPFGFADDLDRPKFKPGFGFEALRAAYPNPALAIVRKDGRLLCPHRKVDLSSFAPDADGVVTCPLHGLRVQCRSMAA